MWLLLGVLFCLLAFLPGLVVVFGLLKLLYLFLPYTCYQYCHAKIWSLFQRMVLLFYCNVNTSRIVLYGDFESVRCEKENCIYIGNHQTDVDWVVCDLLALYQGGIGRLRYVLKNTLKYIPVFGYFFYDHDCVFVDRSAFCVYNASQTLKRIRHYNLPTWLVIFPEGTRVDPNNARLIQKGVQYAEQQGLPPLRHHLTPRSLGTLMLLEHIGNYVDAIYDVTVFYSDNLNRKSQQKLRPPSLMEWFNKTRVIHIHIRRIPIAEVPGSEHDRKVWLHDLFIEKDRLFDAFAKSVDDDEGLQVCHEIPSKLMRISLWDTLPSFLICVLLNVPFLVLSNGLYAYLCVWLFSSLVTVSYSHWFV